MYKDIFRMSVLFIVGFMSYITIEVLYRGYSFAIMGIVGGLLFLMIDQINEYENWNVDLVYQAFLGGIYATLIELIVGLVDAEYLHLNMWDYSDQLGNFLGVICPLFSFYWCLLTILAVLVADFINWAIIKDRTVPHYYIFGKLYEPRIYKLLNEERS